MQFVPAGVNWWNEWNKIVRTFCIWISTVDVTIVSDTTHILKWNEKRGKCETIFDSNNFQRNKIWQCQCQLCEHYAIQLKLALQTLLWGCIISPRHSFPYYNGIALINSRVPLADRIHPHIKKEKSAQHTADDYWENINSFSVLYYVLPRPVLRWNGWKILESEI